jgi:hypothetical protein
MNDIFKNSRGLGDLSKHLHIAYCISDHNLDFVAISETSRREFSQCLLDRLSGGVDFEWTSQPPRGRPGAFYLEYGRSPWKFQVEIIILSSISITEWIISCGV